MLIINNAIKVHYRLYILHEELDGHRQADQIVQAQPGKRERLATYKCPSNHQKSQNISYPITPECFLKITARITQEIFLLLTA